MIAFNLIGTKKNSGTKTFNLNFLKEISYLGNFDNITIFAPKYYLENQNFNFPNKVKIITKSNLLDNFIIRFIWMQFILPLELKINNIKVLFSSSNYSPYLLKILNIKSILYIHTVLPWLHFDLMPGSKLKNYIIKIFMQISIFSSKFILVPSNYAKISLIKELNIRPKKIKVVKLGADHLILSKKNNHKISSFNYKNKYILSVTSCVKYHNILNLLKSFKEFIFETNSKIKFVFVLTILDKEYFNILESFVQNNFKKGQIIFLPNLENKYLVNFYKNSSLYIFTSYSETFGLTSLEAMNFEIPLLLSNTSSFREINGDVPEYFDPDNTSEIKNKIIEVFASKKSISKRYDYLDRNQKHLKNYIWKDTFCKTYKILKKSIS